MHVSAWGFKSSRPHNNTYLTCAFQFCYAKKVAKQIGYKYPRLTLLLFIVVATFTVFSSHELWVGRYFASFGGIGVFISGALYAFSFTSFTASVLFFELGKSGDTLTLSLLGGAGSVVGDLLILKTAKISFHKEFEQLYRERILRNMFRPFPKPLLHTLKIIIAMIIIASPLPDEAGVTLLANGFVLPKKIFITLSFFLNFLGIYSILALGKALQ